MPEVKVDNPNALKALADSLSALEGVTGKVGWFESAQYPDGTPVAYVAAIQEFGSPANSIPSRSFMRSTVMEQTSAWKDLAAKLSTRVLEKKMTAKDAMEALTIQAEGDVAKKIASISSPPLSQITLGVRKYKQMGRKITGSTIGEIARKLKEGTLDVSGVSQKPLVDSAVLVNTLTHTVEG
jgi:hypothetical protein